MIGRRRRRSLGRPTLQALATMALALAGAAIASGTAPDPGRHQVRLGFDKTEPGRRVSRGIPVSRTTNARSAHRRVVYSVALPRLDRTERLRIRGVVGLSRCNESDQRSGGGAHEGALRSPCEFVRHPYGMSGNGRYDPWIGARAFLGSSHSDLRHGIGHWRFQRCSRPRHHCPLVVHTHLDRPRHRDRRAYLNLAVAAFSPHARLGGHGRPLDLVELAGDCRRNDYNPDRDGDGNPTDDSVYCVPVRRSVRSNTRGGLAVIRFGAARRPARRVRDGKLVRHHVRVNARSRILLRERLRHLSAGDVIDAAARFHLRDHRGGDYVFRHFVRGQLFVTADPDALKPHKRSSDRWLSGSAGTNCPHRAGCEIEKAGAITVPRGAPTTMWVNFVGTAVDSGGVNRALTDVTDGHLSVAVDGAGYP